MRHLLILKVAFRALRRNKMRTLLTMLGMPLERFWSFPFSLCAISVLSLRGGVASLRAHNLADHLAARGGSLDTAGWREHAD